MASFLALAEKLSGSGKGAAFYALVEQRSLPTRLARYLLDAFSGSVAAGEGAADTAGEPAATTAGDDEMPDTGGAAWKAALALVGPPLALQLLTALTKGRPVSMTGGAHRVRLVGSAWCMHRAGTCRHRQPFLRIML